ncbi:amino acid adenylation domain-containing protein [Micromonospora luteifusca]|uniref:non-ribosomal peptide synthetase n=1 Tax=Micromonospora luteifusca TaxID=709860 RepID=UPI0033B23F97
MAQELLAELHRRGIRLRLTDGRLDVLAPAGALTPELRERLRQGRDELIGMLGTTPLEEDLPPLTTRPGERHEPFPLTDIQHAYWVGRGSAVELGGVSSHYYFELEREGLDPRRLTDSLRKVIARHDMLRMVVCQDGRQQVLADPPPYEIPVTDLRDLSAEMREKELVRIRTEMDHQVLPGHRWPLFDIRASLLDDRRLRLHVSLDVLILDGFSLFLMFEQWRRFYEEPDWQPEPLTLSYRDHVLWEEAAREGTRYARDEKYWLDRLDTLPPAPALPLAKQPAQLSRTEFTRRSVRLAPERWAAVKQAAQERGLTPSAVLMTAFAQVLRRWSRESSLTLNLTLFNRPPVHPQVNQLIGDFTSVALLAVTDESGESFAGQVRHVQAQLMRDLEHRSYSGVRVLRERGRRLGGGPGAAMPVVFTSALVLGSGEEDPSEGIRFFGEEVYAITQTPQVWLDNQVSEEGGELISNWDAVEALFPAGLLDDMFHSYRRMLERLGDDATAWEETGMLAALPQWQENERTSANRTAAAIPAGSLSELAEATAASCPDATAVLAHDGELTYAETVSHAHRLARRLAALGAARNTLVGVVLEKGWEQVPAVVGVTRAGAAYLPVDPQWPQARRWHLLERGGVRVVVTSPRLRDELAWPAGIELVTLADPEVRQSDTGPLPAHPAPDDLAYVIFTSGSTGEPKGVMIDHRGAANTVQDINARFGVGPDDRVLALSALSFDLSVYDVFGMLAAGGTVVVPAPHQAQDPAHWAELVNRHGVTVWNSVPALMQVWLDAHGSASHRPTSTLRLALLSGDWIPVSMPDAIRALHPQAQVISLGGATEASIWSVCHPIGAVPPEWSSIPYGKPLANQTLHVYDERLVPCPVWTVGEIYIGGRGVASGYWADPDRTAARFVVHPSTGERLYRTGDLGRYLPGGDIEFLGREDSQVKINGYRIELGEITAALLRQPGVGEAVVGVDSNPVTGRRQLVAHVVPGGGDADLVEPAGNTIGWWRRAVEAGRSEVRRSLVELEPELEPYRRVWHAVEALCPLIMARSLALLGMFREVGDTATATGIVERHQLKPGYRGLVDQWLSVLTDAGMLSTTGQPDEYRCTAPLVPETLDQQVREGFAALGASGSQEILVDYVRSCADAQLEMLRGEVSPLQLLMPDGDPQVTEALYASNPVSHLQNRAAAKVVRAVVERSSPDRPVRILEVGAGTGATTAQVLRALPPGRAHYSFTDISTYFTERAKSRFRDHVFLDYGILDIDRQPGSQGFAPGSADIILAANVLHDAKNLDTSLQYLRSLLSPGGALLLIEGTANSLVQAITVGFIEGLGNYQDQRQLPLLSVPQWQSRMTANGFAAFGAIPEGEAAVDAHVQHVLLAAAPDAKPQLDPAGLRAALEGLLPEYLVPRHYLIVDGLPLTANGKVDRAALPAPWEDAAPQELSPPRDDLERRLFGIWRDALGREDFGIDDNFFELGGDSLHAVRILDRLRQDFGMDANADEGLEMLFDSPTIEQLARSLRDRTGA